MIFKVNTAYKYPGDEFLREAAPYLRGIDVEAAIRDYNDKLEKARTKAQEEGKDEPEEIGWYTTFSCIVAPVLPLLRKYNVQFNLDNAMPSLDAISSMF